MSRRPNESRTSAAAAIAGSQQPLRYALLGNPNTGKTTLFNQLCGIRAKTANFPGSTVEARIGSREHGGRRFEIVDLPGHYGINLDRPESRVCKDYLAGRVPGTSRPDAVVVVADATNLARNLVFVSQAIQQGLPAVVALNMTDLARRRSLSIDTAALGRHLGCPVVPIAARAGRGIDALLTAMEAPTRSEAALPDPTNADAAYEWAEVTAAGSVGGLGAVGAAEDTLTDRLDAAFTHPVLGVLLFALVMTGLFYTIFSLATVPMDLIEVLFSRLGALVTSLLPPGAIRELIADGVVAGLAGTLVFLPQICLLFFLISLLEDTGYLARAAFVMDRLLRRFGLPGHAFVPLLSAHACAVPAIMSARLIPDQRDRLATILVAPFLSCSARLPVYVLLIGMLFGDRPLLAALAFTGCYALGAIAALLTSLIARRTLLRGPSRPMVLELPSYKIPSLRSALVVTFDRATVFLRQAGTVIVCICVVLWWLGAYPRVEPPAEVATMRAEAAQLEHDGEAKAAEILARADVIEMRHAKAHTFIGRLGRTVEPVFSPIGCDWQLTVGVLSSFLAREVFVSTMAVILTGSEDGADGDESLRNRILTTTRSDGSPLFTTASAASLLVFYVLAMQCLPTLAVCARETGSWRWPVLQFAWMSAVAYGAALLVHRLVLLLGG